MDMRKSLNLKLIPVLLIMAAVGFTACDPRQLPGFKQEARRQEERITRETEEAIKKSPALQELDRLCAQEIPRPDGFIPVNKYGDLVEGRYLGYGYHSGIDYQGVKSFYLNYFTQHGWQLTKEKEAGWGPSEIEFRKNGYQVTVSDVVRGKEINYFLHCEKLGPTQQTP
jgi:hypothetical protein